MNNEAKTRKKVVLLISRRPLSPLQRPRERGNGKRTNLSFSFFLCFFFSFFFFFLITAIFYEYSAGASAKERVTSLLSLPASQTLLTFCIEDYTNGLDECVGRLQRRR